MITQQPANLEGDLAQLLDAVDELVSLATGGALADDGLTALARRCRGALGADAVLIAVRRAGHPVVVSDADAELDPVELGRQVVLAGASLDDSVIDGYPSLPISEGGARGPVAVSPRHPRRLVTELPGRSHVRGTLTICRHPVFAAEEVELAMAFASLAALVLVQTRPPDLEPAPAPDDGVDVVGRLFAVGIALHLMLRSTGDAALCSVIESAVDQLDLAILDIRRATFAVTAQA